VDEIEFDYYTKKKYTNLIRSSLDNDFLQMLYINCICSGYSDDYSKYNNLITKFEFLEHMNFINDMNLNYNLLLVSQFYDERAFGDSEYFSHIKKTWVYKKIIGNNKYHDKKVFFRSQYIPYKFLENVEEGIRLEFSHNMDEGIILYVHGIEIEKIPYDSTNLLLNEEFILIKFDFCNIAKGSIEILKSEIRGLLKFESFFGRNPSNTEVIKNLKSREIKLKVGDWLGR